MSYCCEQDERRELVRAMGGWIGLDYVEVDNDQVTLYLYFLGKLPPELSEPKPGLEQYLTIAGGTRITGIQVTRVVPVANPDPEKDDYLVVTVNKSGGFSTYTLGLAGVAHVDPRYSRVSFSFKVNCPTDLDCETACVCGPPVFDEPVINYLAKDYESFRQLILDRMAVQMPAWTETHEPDIGIMLVELLAYKGDYLSYYQDAVATEAFLETARQRISVRRHVRLVDYTINEGCNARAFLCVETNVPLLLDPCKIYFITGLNDALAARQTLLVQDDLTNIPAADYEVFEMFLLDGAKTFQAIPAHNEIHFYTWGEMDCCLPKGSTCATLLDAWVGSSDQSAQNQERRLNLVAGDILIFEEVLGPATGLPADADPMRRQAVRLTAVTPGEDPVLLTGGRPTPYLQIEWLAEDALAFPFCISVLGPPPSCAYIQNVSVAHGNVILVDHGMTQLAKNLGCVPTLSTNPRCLCPGEEGDVEIVAGPYSPQLAQEPLTFRQALPSDNIAQAQFASATRLMQQNAVGASPQIQLASTPPANWTVKYDLIESEPGDPDFVVEIDNDGYGHLRFGDGDLGLAPPAGMSFQATYRVGNGTAGNVGAESISRLVQRDNTRLTGFTITVRNPLAAVGGTDPEPIEHIKLFAPHQFSQQIERAITAGDYAQLAERNPHLQRAAASLDWTGSWYEADVAIDPLGTESPSADLIARIESWLECYRRIGHDVAVLPAVYVPLDLALVVCVLPGYLQAHVEAALLDVFSNRVLPGGALGFFHPDNLTFGQGIYLSQIVATGQAVAGVECVQVVRFQRLFVGPNGEIQSGVLSMKANEIAQLDNDPNKPEHGQLSIQVNGGL